jgi:hypothetical protein
MGLQALAGGVRLAQTRRAAASSVAPVATATAAPCVLASLGLVDPRIHREHQETH